MLCGNRGVFRDAVHPLSGCQNLAESHCLGHQDGAMELLGGNRAGVIRYMQGPRSVGQELDGKPEMGGLPRRRVAAHLGHVAANGDRVDAALLEPAFEVRIGKAAGKGFLQQKVEASFGHFVVQLPFPGALDEGLGVFGDGSMLGPRRWESNPHGRRP